MTSVQYSDLSSVLVPVRFVQSENEMRICVVRELQAVSKIVKRLQNIATTQQIEITLLEEKKWINQIYEILLIEIEQKKLEKIGSKPKYTEDGGNGIVSILEKS